MKTQLNIFAYSDYRAFLSDYYDEQKQCAPRRFSYRFFSQRAGFASSNAIYLVMRGKRNLSLRSTRQLAVAMKQTRRQRQYFEQLVEFSQAVTPDDKQRAFAAMLAFREYCEAHELTREQFALYSRWYYLAIRELVNVRGFREDPQWIAKTLRPQVAPEAVQEAIATLLTLGLLARDGRRRLRQAHRHLRTAPEVQSAAVMAFHHDMIANGQHALTLPAQEREVSAVTMSVTRAQFARLKAKIQGWHEEVQELIGTTPADVSAELVVQLNFQLFPLAEAQKE